MIINAKFAGVCGCGCGGRIVAGSKVEWSAGAKAKLLGCTGSSTRPSGPSIRNAAPTTSTSRARSTGRPTCRGCGAWTSGRYPTCYQCSDHAMEREDMGDYSHR